ncbi:MAG: cupin domain-containing protein [Candidatus Dadabacteria bacterium]|nr:cupin domain-containing protein [Candidatus Dadabacteria bacterium]
MNTSRRIIALIVAVGMSLMGWTFAQAQEAEHIMLKPGDIKWTDAPPSMPPGAQVAVIEGDLKKAEPFTFRLKLPAKYTIAPHTHPTIEHVTVISGTFYMGAGDKIDKDKAVALTPGSFAVFQPGHSMFTWTQEETVVQVYGVGPWGINYINPADDPRKK